MTIFYIVKCPTSNVNFGIWRRKMNKEEKDLIRKIIKKTKCGEISWGMSTSIGGSYFCSENNGVRLMMREFTGKWEGVALIITTEEKICAVNDKRLKELHDFLYDRVRKEAEEERSSGNMLLLQRFLGS